MHPVRFVSSLSEFKEVYRSLPSRSSLFVHADTHTGNLCWPLIKKHFPDAVLVESVPGEEHKNLDQVQKLWNRLLDLQADRKSLFVNLGGGVVSDLGGFAASTFKRGIPYINIPTTLLAMVDAAIGGKTGINYAGAKNQIGTVYFPLEVIIFPGFLQTLPEAEFKSGLAEMFKHGLIADAEYFRQMQSYSQFPLEHLIRRSVEIKSDIVRRDTHEKKLRQLLNFGHTAGHALEGFFQQIGRPVTHGHAVALGMIAEGWLSVQTTGLPRPALEEIRSALQMHFDTSPVQHIDIDRVMELMRLDKKNIRNQVHFTLLRDIGKGVPAVRVDDTLIRESLAYLQSL